MERYFNRSDYRENRKTRYVFYWLFWIVIVSIFVMLFQIIYNYDAKGGRCKIFRDASDYKYFDSIVDLASNYPKPFMNLA